MGCIIFLSSLWVGIAAAKDAEYTIRLAHTHTEKGLNYRGTVKFKELVEERRGGRSLVEHYTAGQLGTDKDIQEGIHPVQFVMVVIMCWGIGQQTPPFGSVLYITCSLARADMWEVTLANLPLIAVLAGIIHWPAFFVFMVPKLVGLL